MRPLRLLLVDDNPDDRSLVEREIRREFGGVAPVSAINAATLAKAMADGGFDLVITDYQLLWTDGMQVLREVKHRWPECPVIMFTGTGSEEVAVEAMKSGLDDYVLKGPSQFGRLAATARNVVAAALQKGALQKAERRYQQLFETIPIGLFRSKPSGEILDANPALVSMLGYPGKDALLEVNAKALHLKPEDFTEWRERLERDGSVASIETEWRRADGGARWVEVRAKAVRDSSGQPVYEASAEDITARKNSEREREDLIIELKEALAKVKSLTGLLPICASCKKIRDDHGYWNQIEVFIKEHSNAEFTHSFCPECIKALYPEIFEDMPEKH